VRRPLQTADELGRAALHVPLKNGKIFIKSVDKQEVICYYN
jgi:hypothetical protein